jgi:putative addiction module component (TIGR02574 family)
MAKGMQYHPKYSRGVYMKADQIKDEICRLELSERLLLVEDIWDSIAASNSEIPMPEWQKQELSKRYKEYQEGVLGLHDWKSIHEDLRDKYK